MAIWHHIRSTDKPQHHLCPTGKESWCGYQRDVANNTHKYQHNHPLPAAVADEIKVIFIALSDDALLSSCLHGGTQNQNESINALIWQHATKETHSSLPTVQLATALAIGQFNDGARTVYHVLSEIGIEPGWFCEAS